MHTRELVDRVRVWRVSLAIALIVLLVTVPVFVFEHTIVTCQEIDVAMFSMLDDYFKQIHSVQLVARPIATESIYTAGLVL
jgi:hypothetical protein